MKQFFLSLLVGFALMNLTAQSYIDINFAEANGVNIQTIQVTNLTLGTSVTLQGTDILRLNTSYVGIRSISVADNQLLFYPNPIEQEGFFSFVNPEQGRVEIRLLNLDGKVIHKNSNELDPGKHTFSISGVPNGIHILSVITQAGSFSGRITSTGNKSAQIKTALTDQKNIEVHSSIPVSSRIKSQHENIVELIYSPGDNLHFHAGTQGYVSQGLYASPESNQTITFFLTQVVEVNNPVTGKYWMDRNLGASRAATSGTDMLAYGDLYQWGRGTDGHEKRNSKTTSTLSSSDTPGHGNYITTNSGIYDWRSSQNNNLWQGVNSTNNPCPTGYRVPTAAEWYAEIATWSSNNPAGAYASPLKLLVAGSRLSHLNGLINDIGSKGNYWSNTFTLAFPQALQFDIYSNVTVSNNFRSNGVSVRCLKDVSISDGLLSVTTKSVSNVTSSAASSGGNISSDGGDAVTARGVVWSTSQNPTVSLSTKTSDGTGMGSFTSTITGLQPRTTYYVRAYATNSAGTAYGNEVSFYVSEGGEVYNPATGKYWMDRNLGASRAATSSTDEQAYGDLYQWGRGTDGHEKRISQTTSTLSSNDTPHHGNFITINSGDYDWRSPQNNDLWQGVNGINNPCPEGFRVPTAAELQTEIASWSSNNPAGAFASPLKLPATGYRVFSDGSLLDVGSIGSYWSVTVDGTKAQGIGFSSGGAGLGSSVRTYGAAVRCLKDVQITIVLPSVTTTSVSNITSSAASSGGNISSDGGDAVTARGVVWSTSQNPTVSLSTKTSDGTGMGSFTSTITGLQSGTTYYVRAYATNSAGTAYGNEVSFYVSKGGEVYNPATGKVWMDRNLGASRVATSSTDAEAYGDLYQWGRGADGHEKRNSETTSTLSSSDTPGHGKFITVNSGNYDWRSPQNNNLWQGANGINNPCPEGFRIPTAAEWNAERASWSSNNSAGAFASPLKLPVAGLRSNSIGSLYDVGSYGYYWSSTVNGASAQFLSFFSSNALMYSLYRAVGLSVRCLKDD
jgi:uncharacterized protein (TIGR02145 family)